MTFTPTDTHNYENATATVTIDAAKAKQTLSWSAPAAIVYGTRLSATQLNATVSVVGPSAAGALVYTPPSGIRLLPARRSIPARDRPSRWPRRRRRITWRQRRRS